MGLQGAIAISLDQGLGWYSNGSIYAGIGNSSNVYSLKIHSISGSALVCTSASTFSISNLPTGTIPSWSLSSNLSYVSGQGTNSYVVKAASSSVSGSGWVQATLAISCGSIVLPQFQVWIGNPVISGPSKNGPCTEPTYTYSASNIPGASYTWSINNSNLDLSYNGITANVDNGGANTGGNPFSISVTVTLGSCTVSTTRSTQSYIKKTEQQCSGGGGGGPGPLLVSPNPTSEELTVELIVSDDYTDRFDVSPQDSIYSAQLYSFSNELKKSVPSVNGKVSMDVRDMPPGLYILQIKTKQGVTSKRVQIGPKTH